MATVYELLLTVEEINDLVSGDGQPDKTLENIVLLVANRFETDVCSVYLLEPDRAKLVLAATVGLQKSCIGQLNSTFNYPTMAEAYRVAALNGLNRLF